MLQPWLETPRSQLRPFAHDDWPAINELLTDVEALRHMHFRTWTEHQRRSWFESIVCDGTDSWEWVIETRRSSKVIGWFGIGTSTEPTRAKDISFGYALMRSNWGQGYMTEVMRAVFAHQFGALYVPRLQATCSIDNPASARVMEKAGMRRWKTDFGADLQGNEFHRHHYLITSTDYHRQRLSDQLPDERSCK